MVCTRSHIEHRPRKHSLLIRIHRDRPTRVDLRMLPVSSLSTRAGCSTDR